MSKITHGVYFDGKEITEDTELPTRHLKEITFNNEGTTAVKLNHFITMPAGTRHKMASGDLPILNETMAIRFSGVGVNSLTVSYGKIVPIPCHEQF